MQITQLAEMISNTRASALESLSGIFEFDEFGQQYEKSVGHKPMLIKLLNEHEAIIVSLRKNILACDERSGNANTTSFLNRLIQDHEAIIDILRRYMDRATLNRDN